MYKFTVLAFLYSVIQTDLCDFESEFFPFLLLQVLLGVRISLLGVEQAGLERDTRESMHKVKHWNKRWAAWKIGWQIKTKEGRESFI